MIRKATAQWKGDLKGGNGTVSTSSGVLNQTPYSFSTRFEDVKGTNPEELIAAAHAGCFSMALSAELGKAGVVPESIDTTATLTMEKRDEGFTITQIHLDVRGSVLAEKRDAFLKAANDAKAGCPVSRVLKATITMDAKVS